MEMRIGLIDAPHEGPKHMTLPGTLPLKKGMEVFFQFGDDEPQKLCEAGHRFTLEMSADQVVEFSSADQSKKFKFITKRKL